MIWRHELKYMIDEPTFQHLYFALRPILHDDHHASGDDPGDFNSYLVRSLYFDDAARNGIFEKLAGVDPRHKYRIRIYNDNAQVIHLEKKIKSGNLTHKQACRLSKSQVDGLLDGDPEVLLDDRLAPGFAHFADIGKITADQRLRRREKLLLEQFYADIRCRLLTPALLVDYERIPLVWPEGNVRITFDRHLSTGYYRQDLWDPDAGLQPVLDPGQVILEVKYDRFLPDFIRSLLHLSGSVPLAISKYVQCAGFCRRHSWEDQN